MFKIHCSLLKENTSFSTILRTFIIFATNQVNFNYSCKMKTEQVNLCDKWYNKIRNKWKFKTYNFNHKIILKTQSPFQNTILPDGKKNTMTNTYLESNKKNNHKNLKDSSRIIVKGKFIMVNACLLRTREWKLIKY